MAKVGRPTKYKEEYAQQAFKYCLLGADNEKLAQFFEVSISSIDKWIKDHKEFSSAIKAGREDADALVAQSLYHRALGYSHKETKVFCNQDGMVTEHDVTKHYAPDTRAAELWLRNRRPKKWNQKQDVNLSGDGIEFHLHVPEPKE